MKHVRRFAFLSLLVLALIATVRPSPSLAGRDERVLVEFAPGHGPAVRAALQRAGGRVHYNFDRINVIAVSLPAAAVDGMRRNPHVISVVEDAPRYPMATGGDQVVPWGIDAVQARDVWDADLDGIVDDGAPTGDGITVCIIDSGLGVGHEDFAGVDVIGGSPAGWDTDLCGHGTHVAGTIAAADNDLGVVGVTPGAVSLFIVKVFGDDCAWAYSSTLMAATEECVAADADIISMSLGGPKALRPEERQFDALYDTGLLSVAAAGNDGDTSYNYPASYDSVVSVGAIDEARTVADFSQWNDQVELAAPGVDVLSTVPWVAVSELIVGDAAYTANHIEYALYGTATGTLVDGGLCTTTGDWNGDIVLCERGDISFLEKVMNVQNSGGVAAVIYNNEPGNFLGTLGDEKDASDIVAISLSQEDGQYLVDNDLGETGTINSDITIGASGYEAWGGTSMATPHVSAVAALLWSADPAISNTRLRSAMIETALDLGPIGRDPAYGYGLVQAAEALDRLEQSEGLILSATASKVKGQKTVDLTWSGASTPMVRILRNESVIATVAGDAGSYTDLLDRQDRGAFTYVVCEVGTDICSNAVTIDF